MVQPSQSSGPGSPLDTLTTRVLVEEAVRGSQPRDARRKLLAALRRREDHDAQVAAALVCFDLARGGDPIARMELGVLRTSFAQLASRPEALAPVLDGSPALSALWSEVRAYLDREDPRDLAPAFTWPSESGPAVLPPKTPAPAAAPRVRNAPSPAKAAPGAAPAAGSVPAARPTPRPTPDPAPASEPAPAASAPPRQQVPATPPRPIPPPLPPAARASSAPSPATPVIRGRPLPPEPAAPRPEPRTPPPQTLSDEDFEDDVADDLFDLSDTGRAAERRAGEFRQMLRAHLGHDLASGRVNLGAGLSTSTAEDLDRLETFLREVAGRAKLVPQARGLSSLGHLFFAVNLRRRTALGQVNPRWEAALLTGLVGFKDDLDSLGTAAALFGSEGKRAQQGFEKVLELLIDFFAFCHAERLDPTDAEAARRYAGECRLPPKVLADDPDARRR